VAEKKGSAPAYDRGGGCQDYFFFAAAFTGFFVAFFATGFFAAAFFATGFFAAAFFTGAFAAAFAATFFAMVPSFFLDSL
jgi:hypothetical protein